MAAVAFDTLKLADRLEAGGFTQAQARTAAFADAMTGSDLAVRSDIGAVQTDTGALKTDMVAVKADIATLKTDVAELKADVAVLKADVAVLKADVAVLKADVALLKTDVAVLKTDVANIKTDIAAIRSEAKQTEFRLEAKIEAAKVDLLNRMIGALAINAAVVLAGMFGLAKLLGH